MRREWVGVGVSDGRGRGGYGFRHREIEWDSFCLWFRLLFIRFWFLICVLESN